MNFTKELNEGIDDANQDVLNMINWMLYPG